MGEPKRFLDKLFNIINGTIQCIYMHPVTFKLVFTPFGPEDFEDEDDTDFYKNITWDTKIYDTNIITATGRTHQTGNKDGRGGGCGDLNIPKEEFVYTIHNPEGITVRDITEIVYRLKGSKYDWWYELLVDIEPKWLENGRLEFNAEFDYGS